MTAGALLEECRAGTGPEVRGMARTLRRWSNQILAWHTTGASNGPTEGLNSHIKMKRIAAGYRNFVHYRLRVLLRASGCNWALLAT